MLQNMTFWNIYSGFLKLREMVSWDSGLLTFLWLMLPFSMYWKSALHSHFNSSYLCVPSFALQFMIWAGYLTLLRLLIGLTTTYNSGSWGFSALFWPLWALDMHLITYIHAGNMHIHKTQYKHLKEANKIICASSMLQYQLSKSVNQPCRMFNIGVAFCGNLFHRIFYSIPGWPGFHNASASAIQTLGTVIHQHVW